MFIGNSFKFNPLYSIIEGIAVPYDGKPPCALPAGKTELSFVIPNSCKTSKAHKLFFVILKPGALKLVTFFPVQSSKVLIDFSSIVFSDEGEILRNSRNPGKDYNEIIRPWKSQLAILYIKHKSISLDIYLIIITVIALFSNPIARLYVSKLVYWLSDDKKLSDICKIQLRITRINDDEKT